MSDETAPLSAVRVEPVVGRLPARHEHECGAPLTDDCDNWCKGKLRGYKQANERDAARYRWLRARDLDTITEGGLFVGMTPDNVVLNGVDMDIAIDAAMLTPNTRLYRPCKVVNEY